MFDADIKYNLERYKIVKLKKMAIGMGKDYYRAENFRYGRKEKYEKNIDHIIRDDKIHPIHIDLEKNYLMFLEVDSVIDNNNTAFFYEPLQLKAKYIIKVDIEHFNSYMEKCENNVHEEKFLFIHHPGRCGSTLLHRILGSHPQVESFSEHLVLNNLFLDHNTKTPNFEPFCKSFFSYFYKKYSGGDSKYLSFKMTGSSAKYIDKLLDILPDAKHIYITRDPIKISESFANLYANIKIGKIRIGYVLKLIRLFSWKKKIFWGEKKGNDDAYGFSVNKHFNLGIINEKIKRIRSASFAELTILRVLITDMQFGYYGQKHKKMIMLKYEDVIQKDKLFGIFSDFLKIDDGFNESVCTNHSHSNSIGAIAIDKRYKYSDGHRNKLISFQEYVKELL